MCIVEDGSKSVAAARNVRSSDNSVEPVVGALHTVFSEISGEGKVVAKTKRSKIEVIVENRSYKAGHED